MKTAREQAEAIVLKWTTESAQLAVCRLSNSTLNQLRDAIAAALEEKGREIARLKAELIEGVKLVAEFTEEIKAKGK